MELTRNIRFRKLQCMGYMLKMDERAPKALKGNTEGTRLVRMSRERWIDTVDKMPRVC
jgi:hypothetical protein